jgi:tol-pal system protein YbgF
VAQAPTGGTLGSLNPGDLSGQGAGRNAPPGPNAPPEALYNYAFGLLEVQDYARAEEAFKNFLAKNPSHSLSGNAQYWLAETYYARRDLDRAAAAFAEGYQKYPTGAKAADNLLKLGVTLAQLGRTKDACVTFAEMEKQFANAPANLLRYAERQRSQLRC